MSRYMNDFNILVESEKKLEMSDFRIPDVYILGERNPYACYDSKGPFDSSPFRFIGRLKKIKIYIFVCLRRVFDCRRFKKTVD